MKTNCLSYRFNGMPLQTLLVSMRGVERFRRYLSTEIFPNLDPVVAVYGEFMCNGTATSKSCKFDYFARGYSQGNFYAFGLTVYFERTRISLSRGEMERARKVMAEKTGLAVMMRADPEEGLLCHMSRKLCELFTRFGLRLASSVTKIMSRHDVIRQSLTPGILFIVELCHFKKCRS